MMNPINMSSIIKIINFKKKLIYVIIIKLESKYDKAIISYNKFVDKFTKIL